METKESRYEEILRLLDEGISSEALEQVLKSLSQLVEKRMGLAPVVKHFKVIHNPLKAYEITNKLSFLNLGVNRTQESSLLIEFCNVSDSIKNAFLDSELTKVFALREALYLFIPFELGEDESTKIFINKVIEKLLEKSEYVKKWEKVFNKYMIDSEYIDAEYGKIDKLFDLKGRISYVFQFFRKNAPLLKKLSKYDFINEISSQIVLHALDKYGKKDDELIETVRIIKEIFYEVKSYKALLEYKKHFRELKSAHILKTSLGLNKFAENMKYLNDYTNIAPTYQVNWLGIDVAEIFVRLQFNPDLTSLPIKKIIDLFFELRFLSSSKVSVSNFSNDLICRLLIPRVYNGDLKKFLQKLKDREIITSFTLILYNGKINDLNLNYFREFHDEKQIINPNYNKYDKIYEIRHRFQYASTLNKRPMMILEFLLLDRIQRYAVTGFPFERRSETIKRIKNDLFNEVIRQKKIIRSFLRSFTKIRNNNHLKEKFLDFLDTTQKYGFFYAKDFLFRLVRTVKVFHDYLRKNHLITSLPLLIGAIKEHKDDLFFHENLKRDNKIEEILFTVVFPAYFTDKTHYISSIKTYQIFNALIEACFNLKIFNISTIKAIVKDQNLVDTIISSKREKLRESYQKYKLSDITSGVVDGILDSFLEGDAPLIKPLLTSSINTTSFSKYHIQLLLVNNQFVSKSLDILRTYFPRVVQNPGEEIIHVDLYIPSITPKEKHAFISIIYNLFGKHLLSLKRYFSTGLLEVRSGIDHYALDREKFFYSPDLFDQLYVDIDRLVQKRLRHGKAFSNLAEEMFWVPESNFKSLIDMQTKRVLKQRIDFEQKKINSLTLFFQKSCRDYGFLSPDLYKQDMFEGTLNQYVKKVAFIPSLQSFGFSKYILYVKPFKLENTLESFDFRLVLRNTFQSVKFSAEIDGSKSFLIKYLFPYRTPNIGYVNWLAKSKKNIAEYCLFYLKKIHLLFQFDANFSKNGWDLDYNKFEIHVQKSLFDKDGYLNGVKTVNHDLDFPPSSGIFGHKTEQFIALKKICKEKYGVSELLFKHKMNEELELLKKDKLILPYLKLKNLEFTEKIYVLLPKTDENKVKTLIKIFSFFNYGYIYEIEGEFFIHEMKDATPFESGLFVKLYLPEANFSELLRIFRKLFDRLKIDKFLIFSDLLKSPSLLRNVFENWEEIEKQYNPYENLLWSKEDNKWFNHKIFTERFEPIYPDLIPSEKEEFLAE